MFENLDYDFWLKILMTLIVSFGFYMLSRYNEKNKDSKSFISDLKKNILTAKIILLQLKRKIIHNKKKL